MPSAPHTFSFLQAPAGPQVTDPACWRGLEEEEVSLANKTCRFCLLSFTLLDYLYVIFLCECSLKCQELSVKCNCITSMFTGAPRSCRLKLQRLSKQGLGRPYGCTPSFLPSSHPSQRHPGEAAGGAQGMWGVVLISQSSPCSVGSRCEGSESGMRWSIGVGWYFRLGGKDSSPEETGLDFRARQGARPGNSWRQREQLAQQLTWKKG